MKNAIRYGLLFASAIFLWAVIEWLVGLHGRFIRYHEYLSYFFAVPSVAVIYWGVRGGDSQAIGKQSFGRAFARGLAITGVATLLCPLVWYVFCTWVNPGFLEAMARHAVEAKGVGTRVAEMRYALTNHLLVSTLSTAVIGAVISLVVAVVVAKHRP